MEEKKDFKEVKVKVTGGHKEFADTLSRSMLYSGVNIFGQLTQLYMKSKDTFSEVALQHQGQASQGKSAIQEGALGGASGNSSMMSLGSNVL